MFLFHLLFVPMFDLSLSLRRFLYFNLYGFPSLIFPSFTLIRSFSLPFLPIWCFFPLCSVPVYLTFQLLFFFVFHSSMIFLSLTFLVHDPDSFFLFTFSFICKFSFHDTPRLCVYCLLLRYNFHPSSSLRLLFPLPSFPGFILFLNNFVFHFCMSFPRSSFPFHGYSVSCFCTTLNGFYPSSFLGIPFSSHSFRCLFCFTATLCVFSLLRLPCFSLLSSVRFICSCTTFYVFHPFSRTSLCLIFLSYVCPVSLPNFEWLIILQVSYLSSIPSHD